jgi:hypothetical protein
LAFGGFALDVSVEFDLDFPPFELRIERGEAGNCNTPLLRHVCRVSLMRAPILRAVGKRSQINFVGRRRRHVP